MADKMKALGAYRPRVMLRERAEIEDVSGYIAGKTGFGEGVIRHALDELHRAVLFFSLNGKPVNLPGLGAFTPTIDLEGRIKLGFRADARLIAKLNMRQAFRGTLVNMEHAGSTMEDLIARWNEEHPEDPVH